MSIGARTGDGRAYGSLAREHLSRLSELAWMDREGLFKRCPHLDGYRSRVLSVALCQGGALHYVDGRNGVKDIDVWTLYAVLDHVAYPPRRTGRMEDIGMPGLTGWTNRVDLPGRSLPFAMHTDPATVWLSYLTEPRTKTARMLGMKPVVLLEPSDRRGEVVWHP